LDIPRQIFAKDVGDIITYLVDLISIPLIRLSIYLIGYLGLEMTSLKHLFSCRLLIFYSFVLIFVTSLFEYKVGLKNSLATFFLLNTFFVKGNHYGFESDTILRPSN